MAPARGVATALALFIGLTASSAFVTPRPSAVRAAATSQRDVTTLEDVVADVGTRLGPDTYAGLSKVLENSVVGVEGLYSTVGLTTLFFVAIGVNGRNRVLPPPPPPLTPQEKLLKQTALAQEALKKQLAATKLPVLDVKVPDVKLPPIDVRVPDVKLPPIAVTLPEVKSKAVEDAVRPIAKTAVTVYKATESAARATPAATKKLQAAATKAYAAAPQTAAQLRVQAAAAAKKQSEELAKKAGPELAKARTATTKAFAAAGPEAAAAAAKLRASAAPVLASSVTKIKATTAPLASNVGASAAKYAAAAGPAAAKLRGYGADLGKKAAPVLEKVKADPTGSLKAAGGAVASSKAYKTLEAQPTAAVPLLSFLAVVSSLLVLPKPVKAPPPPPPPPVVVAPPPPAAPTLDLSALKALPLPEKVELPALDLAALPALDLSALPALDLSALPALDLSALPALDLSAIELPDVELPSFDLAALPALDLSYFDGATRSLLEAGQAQLAAIDLSALPVDSASVTAGVAAILEAADGGVKEAAPVISKFFADLAAAGTGAAASSAQETMDIINGADFYSLFLAGIESTVVVLVYVPVFLFTFAAALPPEDQFVLALVLLITGGAVATRND